MEDKRTVEINGIKMEVDMRTATRVDQFRVGDNIKILNKEYNGFKVENGVIVDFLNFKDLPTIQVAIFEQSYQGSTIRFININSETENVEFLPASRHEMQLEKKNVVDQMNNEITSLENKKKDLEAKLNWFIDYYGKYFEGEK